MRRNDCPRWTGICILKPLGIEAALEAVEARKTEAAEKRRQFELALKQARYEAALARRQYDAVDPDNRLVASELERRWNEKLIAVRQLEDEFEAVEQQRPLVLGDEERDRLLRLGADLETAWSHPAATMATRKPIVRTVLHEIVVRVENGFVDMVLHWRGGDHTALKVKKNTSGKHRWTVAEETETLVHELARLMPDRAIASPRRQADRSQQWLDAKPGHKLA